MSDEKRERGFLSAKAQDREFKWVLVFVGVALVYVSLDGFNSTTAAIYAVACFWFSFK